MRRALASAFAIVAASTPAFAEDTKKRAHDLFFFAPAVGISYPLVASIGAGALLPMGKADGDDLFPTLPAVRADVEAGLGGATVAAGFYIPAGSFAFNAKAASMRTWLLAWNQPRDRTYDGFIVELVALGHVPGKIGLGRFRERATGGDERDELTYLFVGVGF